MMRVLMQHRTAEPVPMFWLGATAVGVVLGVVLRVTLGWAWLPVTVVWLLLVWLVFLATASAFGAPALIGNPAQIDFLSTRIFESLTSGLGGMGEAGRRVLPILRARFERLKGDQARISVYWTLNQAIYALSQD